MGPANLRLNPVGVAVIVGSLLCFIIYTFGVPGWFSNEPNVSLKELLSASIHLAEKAGGKVSTIRQEMSGNMDGEARVKGLTREGKAELLTRGDSESHRTIFYGMTKAFPNLMIVSEETDIKPIDMQNIEDVEKYHSEVEKIIKRDALVPLGRITVWVDPLDATQEYTENLVKFVTVMVCVAVDGIPTIGVIHKPFSKETFWAWVDNGNSENLQVAKKSTLDENPKFKFIVSRSHAGDVEKVAKAAYGNDTIVVPAGGAGYKTIEVIKGSVDAYLHTTLIKKWDICAGNAFMNALKGKMTTLKGELITYSSKKEFKNEDGLLATTYGHYGFLEKLSELQKNA